VAESDSDKIYNLAMKQVETAANLSNAQHDINEIGSMVRGVDDKVDAVKNDLRIYKALSGFIAAIVVILAWIISNIDNIKGIFK
jgi:predicted phage-related endonuclease